MMFFRWRRGTRCLTGAARALVLLAFGLTLGACGFHLRHAVKLPAQMDVVFIQGTAMYGELGREIARSLRNSGSSVTDLSATATAVLIIHRDQVRRRVVSVNRMGQANEYELTYYLRFEVHDAKGRVVVPAQTISLMRDYTFDPNSVLAKGNEEADLRGDMIRFAVREMFQRIDSALGASDR